VAGPHSRYEVATAQSTRACHGARNLCAGRDRIVVALTDDTDWEEIRELVTESYRILAPEKLTALLD